MNKSKGQTVDLLYSNNKDKEKNKIKNKKNDKNLNINLDNEIIIGLTPKTAEPQNKNSKVSKKNKKQNNKKNIRKNEQVKTKKKTKKIKEINNKNKKKSKKIKVIKWTCIISVMIATIILFMMSSIFNIKEIKVLNNNRISTEKIISLSGLKTDTNMFKITKGMIKNNIKTNAYVEDVIIKRGINGTITIDIKERVPAYMLKFANAYVYINNQGYMLEISEVPLKLPIITGFSTSTDDLKEGNRLNVEDLKRLEDVIQIMESAKSNSLANIISSIDISDSTNYKLSIESEAKTVQFGEVKNINIKILKIEEVIQQEKGIAGDIYFQDSEKTVFREKV